MIGSQQTEHGISLPYKILGSTLEEMHLQRFDMDIQYHILFVASAHLKLPLILPPQCRSVVQAQQYSSML